MKLNGKEKHIEETKSYYSDAKHERDMLDGNLNRMFVSDDIDEIITMYMYAKFRINLIYHYCLKMYEEKEEERCRIELTRTDTSLKV